MNWLIAFILLLIVILIAICVIKLNRILFILISIKGYLKIMNECSNHNFLSLIGVLNDKDREN